MGDFIIHILNMVTLVWLGWFLGGAGGYRKGR
jgi:hypothetical protein